MSKAIRAASIIVLSIVGFLGYGFAPAAQGPVDNPYRPVRGLADGGGPSVPGGEWARLPGGREMGPPASVYVDIDGDSICLYPMRRDQPCPRRTRWSLRARLHESRGETQAARHDLQVRSQRQRRE